MENESIDDKYIILNKIDKGGTSKVFLVKEKDSEEICIAKVLKEKNNDENSKKYFKQEINVLKYLKEKKCDSYIVNFVNSGEGEVKRIDHPITINRYLILGYEEKGCLFDYIYYPKSGFSEKHSKLIFSKILKGIQAIHNQNICHRDIKLENILVDKNYNPILCDFGFATFNKENLEEYLGTQRYESPQIIKNKPYNGFKNDIFSLGQILMILVAARPGFNVANDKEEEYSYIKSKNEFYWTYLEVIYRINNLSSEFKNLYFEILSYSEDERPEIEEILDSDWMKEIKDLNESQIKDLETEVIEEFKRREEIIKEQKRSKIEIEGKVSSELGTIRSMEDNKNNFDYNSKPYDIKKGKLFDNFIIIKTNLHPVTLMNKLIKKLSDNYGNKCDIVINEEKLKFYISFEKEEIEQEEITEKMKEELQKLDFKFILFNINNIRIQFNFF